MAASVVISDLLIIVKVEWHLTLVFPILHDHKVIIESCSRSIHTINNR